MARESRAPVSRPAPRLSPSACLPRPTWRFSGLCAESLRVRRSGGFVVTWHVEVVRGCGCRSQAARRATIKRRRDRHGSARAQPSRWAAPGRRDGRWFDWFATLPSPPVPPHRLALPAMPMAASPASAMCPRDTTRLTGSGSAARADRRSRGPIAPSNSRRSSSSTGSPISPRRPGGTGTVITASSR